MISVRLLDQQPIPVHRRRLRRLARGVLRRLDVAAGELSIALVDDARMRALNRRYRRVDRTTDVLAFPPAGAPSARGGVYPGRQLDARAAGTVSRGGPAGRAAAHRAARNRHAGAIRAVPDGSFRPEPSPPLLLGDVVLSVETAARRAPLDIAPRATGCLTGLHAELARCLIHGIAHLRGWDHHTPPARRRMRRLERRLWEAGWDDEDSGGRSAARRRG